ncbi:hypothetical protein OPT61_g2901 [Boeremia exigua]|uniref:Uncharacterized protein n=1 Tax=Boeremia exigua TaxID=749465 RepID=A0ACC2IK30_9PLEO|nr:hypothetical protein OPT61_g2901 [Boeremia exigua]
MAQSTAADLKPYPTGYESDREVGDVLLGEDKARPLIEASASGNETVLQSLLSQPQHVQTMLEKPHCIYVEDRPRKGPGDVRSVAAMRRSNVERALLAAAEIGDAAIVSTLVDFAIQHNMKESDVITRFLVTKIIDSGHAAVFKALASAYPDVINFHIHHGFLPLYEAVRLRRVHIVAVLLELGADPLPPLSRRDGSYNQSLMSLAAMSQYPHMTEMLLEHGMPIPHTGALHTAARHGRLDTMRLLLQHGADVNETVGEGWHCWTPLHFAASRGAVDAMKLLEQSGAQSDVKDTRGKTAAEVLEEFSATDKQ